MKPMKKKQSKKSESAPLPSVPRVIHSWTEIHTPVDIRPKYKFGEDADSKDMQDAAHVKRARTDAAN